MDFETPPIPQPRRDFDSVLSTEPRFGFDNYCNLQWFLVREPVASGVVICFNECSMEGLDYYFVPGISMSTNLRSPAASGALSVDAGLLFADINDRPENMPVSPTWHSFWGELACRGFRSPWLSQRTIVTGATRELLATLAPVPLPVPASTPPAPIADVGFFPAVDIATPYSAILDELKHVERWSLKRLARWLGTSHTQLGRIVRRGVVPGDELAPRIDELYRFALRLRRLANGDATRKKRLLTTPRERDMQSAIDLLERNDFRNAFRAVMEAASPRHTLASLKSAPRLWTDQPSVDLYDDEVFPDD